LKEAEEWGSLKDGGKTFRERLRAEQQRRPSPPKPNVVQPSQAEVDFRDFFGHLLDISDSAVEAGDSFVEHLAWAAYRCFEYQQSQIERLQAQIERMLAGRQ